MLVLEELALEMEEPLSLAAEAADVTVALDDVEEADVIDALDEGEVVVAEADVDGEAEIVPDDAASPLISSSSLYSSSSCSAW